MQGSGSETGTVLKTEGTSATVITNKSKSCQECGKAQAGICGKGGSGMVITVDNSLGAVQGETVELGLARNTHAKGLFIAFIFPILVLIVCSCAGHILTQYMGIKGLDVIAGLTGLILSILYSFRKIRTLDKSTHLHIIKILSGHAEYGVGSSSEEIDYLHAFNRS